jgi:hypothetical protein
LNLEVVVVTVVLVESSSTLDLDSEYGTGVPPGRASGAVGVPGRGACLCCSTTSKSSAAYELREQVLGQCESDSDNAGTT